MKTRSLARCVWAVILSVAAVGCRPPATEISFAQLPITYSATTEIAKEKGLFQAEGLNVVVVSSPAGPDVMNALRSKSPSSPIIGGIAITPVASMIAAGDHPIILATTLRSDRRVKLVSFDASGITDDPLTLNGKRVGIVRNTVGDIYLSRLLAKSNLTQNDVTIANGRPAELKNLLLGGDLDAVTLWDPFVVQTVREYRRGVSTGAFKDRGKIKVTVEPGLYELAFNVVTTREKLEGHREDIKRFLSATVRGGDYINANRDSACGELEHWLELEKDDLKDFVYTSDFTVSLDVPAVKRWLEEEVKWLKSVDPEAKVPDDFGPYVLPDLLKEVAPSRVTQ